MLKHERVSTPKRRRPLLVAAVLCSAPTACHTLLRQPATAIRAGRYVHATTPSTSRAIGAGANIGAGGALLHDRRRGTCVYAASVLVREWSGKVDEAEAVRRLLADARGGEGGSEESSNDFDPEGPLDFDLGSAAAVTESYDPADGGCFLVAFGVEEVGGDGDGNDADAYASGSTLRTPPPLLGTMGLVVGTPITHLRSGASVSEPARVTAALRRACCAGVGIGIGVASHVDSGAVLRALLAEAEGRARLAGADNLIALAYRHPPAGPERGGRRPDPDLLEECGYSPLPTQIGGLGAMAVQYGKVLAKAEPKPSAKDIATGEDQDLGTDAVNLPVHVRGSSVLVRDLAVLAFLSGCLALGLFGVSSFMGLELSRSTDNRGAGSPLTMQEVVRLREDERMQRTDIDGNGGAELQSEATTGVKRWEELGDEEQREEAALMRIIERKNVRMK